MQSGKQMLARLSVALFCLTAPSAGHAQMETNAPALSPSTFQRIDGNGVDLITGRFNFAGPRLRAGAPPREADFQLSWNGFIWSFPSPSLWMDDDGDLLLNTGDQIEEFDYKGNRVWEPTRVSSSSISCIFYDQNVLQKCTYTLQNGFRGYFEAISPYTGWPIPDFLLPNGNVTANIGSGCAAQETCYSSVVSTPGDQSIGIGSWRIRFGNLYSTTSTARLFSYEQTGSGGTPIDTLSISTPSADKSGRYDDSVIRPKNTTQVMTEGNGAVWRFTFSSAQDLTAIQRPGSTTNDVTIVYDSSHRVKSLTNASGTWQYAYSTFPTSKTTVTKPDNSQYNVTYIKKKGNIRTHTDELGRLTTYNYDTGNRIREIIYPEQNRVVYEYDSRGNVTSVTRHPKPGTPEQATVTRAEYAPSCLEPKNCNLPIAIVDARNNRTEYTYQDGFILTETKPAPKAGAARPQVRWKYARVKGRALQPDGQLVRISDQLLPIEKSECMTSEGCIGTPDEVRTIFDYGPETGPNPSYLRGVTVVHNGQTRRTCYEYDGRGNRIAERKPAANLSACYAPGPAPPSFSIGDASVTEGGVLAFTVTKGGTTQYTYSLSYATENGTAVAPGDFAAVSSGWITFAPGETSKTITVTTVDDSLVEGTETLKVRISTSWASDDAVISRAEGTGSILDNDTNNPPPPPPPCPDCHEQ